MPKWFLVQGYEVDPNRLPHPDQGLPQPQPPSGSGGPVDPGYSPPWAQIPVDPGYGHPIEGRPHPGHDLPLFPFHPIVVPPGGVWPSPPIPGQPPLVIWGPGDPRPTHPIQLPPWAGGWQPGIWGPLDPRPTPPIVIPPQLPDVPEGDPAHMHMVAYVPKSDGTGYERITFTVEIPPPPTEATPKA